MTGWNCDVTGWNLWGIKPDGISHTTRKATWCVKLQTEHHLSLTAQVKLPLSLTAQVKLMKLPLSQPSQYSLHQFINLNREENPTHNTCFFNLYSISLDVHSRLLKRVRTREQRIKYRHTIIWQQPKFESASKKDKLWQTLERTRTWTLQETPTSAWSAQFSLHRGSITEKSCQS